MIKVALLGAPSSGKTELATELANILNSRSSQPTHAEVVDAYVPAIEERSDNTLGHFASYLGNLQVALGRWERERQLVRDQHPDFLITCGTIVETTIYEAVNALVDASVGDGENLTIRALQNNKRASVTMTMLGIISYDTWDYDLAYYLPMSEDADQPTKVVDNHIIEAAEALGVPVKTLDTDAIATIVQDITAYEAETTASD